MNPKSIPNDPLVGDYYQGAAMTPTSASSSARGKRAKFTPQAIEKIKELVAQGASREEIANSLAVTVGSLQVTCSRLGISLRRRDASGPGGPRTVGPPYLPSHPPIAGQRHTGTGFQITLTLECNGTRRTTELPLTRFAIVQLKLEAEMRNLSMGQLLAEVASMAIKKGMIEEILYEKRGAPLRRET